MKKNIIVICMIFLCILLSGCGNNLSLKSGTLNCSKTEVDEDGYSTTDNMIATYRNDKIIKTELTSVMETSPELIDFTFNILDAYGKTLSEIDGISVKYSKSDNNKIKSIFTVDYSKVDFNALKQDLGDLYDENTEVLKNFDITVDDFKQSYVSDGYVCN